MANTYTYSGPATRWSTGDPTAVDYLNVSRVNSDHLYEALNTIITTASITAGSATALKNGTTATTQSASDNSTKIATTAYVDASSTSPGGSNTQVQYNNSGAFGGSANLTFDGSTLTVTGDQHIANGGALVVGNTSQVATNTITAETQIQGTANADATMSVSRYSADTVPPRIHLAKSRNATIGNVTGAVASGDSLGQLVFCGSDGTDFNNMGAYIECPVTGSVSGDTMPAAMTFYTNAGGSIAERMRILSSGGITFNGDTAAANALDDYEIGSWTATLTYSSSYTTYTCTENTGKYVKIGRLVYVTSNINVTNPSASNSSTVGLAVTGLPFTVTNDTACHSRLICDFSKYNGGSTLMGITSYAIPNTTIIQPLRIFNNGAGWAGPNTAEFYLSSGTAGVFITGCYHTDA
jgi:hypothetical protein